VGLCQETDRSRPAALRPKSRSPPPLHRAWRQCLPPDEAWRESTLGWLATLPLALERGEGREGLRVVHA